MPVGPASLLLLTINARELVLSMKHPRYLKLPSCWTIVGLGITLEVVVEVFEVEDCVVEAFGVDAFVVVGCKTDFDVVVDDAPPSATHVDAPVVQL